MATALTHAEVLALPASVPIVTAGRAFGLSRSATFDAHHAGTFPAPVLRVGSKLLVVPRAALLRALQIEEAEPAAAPEVPAEVLERIRRYHASGASASAIARILGADGVTIADGVPWSKDHVEQVVTGVPVAV